MRNYKFVEKLLINNQSRRVFFVGDWICSSCEASENFRITEGSGLYNCKNFLFQKWNLKSPTIIMWLKPLSKVSILRLSSSLVYWSKGNWLISEVTEEEHQKEYSYNLQWMNFVVFQRLLFQVVPLFEYWVFSVFEWRKRV